MTSKGLALVVACMVALSACGFARPAGRAIQPEPTTLESPTETSTDGAEATTPDVSPEPTTPEESGSEPSEPVESSPSTTTTNPDESIDLSDVQDALDALDDLFGDLDEQIGAVDLDEGETP